MKKLIRPSLAMLVLALCLSLAVCAQQDGMSPIAENLEITTYRGVSAGGKLSAVDPDGDAVSFEIVTPPTKGVIELGEDGCFVYTPDEGRRGKDYFGYKAVDSDGNYSQEATVIIKICKQKTKVTYSDMSGNAGEYAAVTLAEKGIFVGENLAGSYVFCPDRQVSREEFLAMCMELTGKDLLTDVTSTGFADDSDIDDWAKPYVSTALRCGIISGYSSQEGTNCFNAGGNITAAEAAVMLDRALGLTDTAAVWMEYETAVPAWACRSAANLAACGMIPASLSMDSSSLNRAQTAEMLTQAMAVLEKR
jgi:hypothetical protein